VTSIRRATHTIYRETVEAESPFKTAGDLYAALAYLAIDGVDLDKYRIVNAVTLDMSNVLKLERLPDVSTQ
jgi:hypothetical protein